MKADYESKMLQLVYKRLRDTLKQAWLPEEIAKLGGRLKQAGLDDTLVLVGGAIPRSDILKLKALGVAEVFHNRCCYGKYRQVYQDKRKKQLTTLLAVQNSPPFPYKPTTAMTS